MVGLLHHEVVHAAVHDGVADAVKVYGGALPYGILLRIATVAALYCVCLVVEGPFHSAGIAARLRPIDSVIMTPVLEAVIMIRRGVFGLRSDHVAV